MSPHFALQAIKGSPKDGPAYHIECDADSSFGPACDVNELPCLFNITKDPCELVDLSRDPKYDVVLFFDMRALVFTI